MVIRTVSVCSGIGGLDLGLKFADSRIRTICYVEREAYAAAVLVARMEEQVLDLAPIWDDFTTLRGEEFLGRVDLVVGGIPCQPYSVAGKQKGADDERDLWGAMARFLGESGRPALFLENVSAFVSGALDRVLWDLAEMGYSAEWGVFSNESLGASHRRERLFLLAYSDSARLQGSCQRQSPFGVFTQKSHSVGFWAPAFDSKWRGVAECLRPAYKPAFRGVANGVPEELDILEPERKERIKGLGNAVSPPVAAVAWRVLTDRAFGGELGV